MKRIVAAVALVLVLFVAAHTAVVAAPETRVALVIGNSAYIDAPLANPVNDARLMAETLRGLGFDVIERTDATQREMKLAIFELGDRLEAAGKDAVGLFFYAGHGVQVDGQNYLIPLNAEITKERHVAIEAVGAGWVLSQMEFAGNRVNFVILDACRNNPLTRGFRSQLRGLAKMDAPTGSLIAYSTGPGDVAVDGDGVNSPYTLALSRVMQMPGLPAEKVFKLVRDAVREATKGEQTPWEESSMTGADFYFSVNLSVTVGTAGATTTSSTDTEATERLFWQSIQNSTDPGMFDEYLRQFPGGTFAGLARRKRDALLDAEQDETQTAAIVPPPEASVQVEEMDATFVAPPKSSFDGKWVIEIVDLESLATERKNVQITNHEINVDFSVGNVEGNFAGSIDQSGTLRAVMTALLSRNMGNKSRVSRIKVNAAFYDGKFETEIGDWMTLSSNVSVPKTFVVRLSRASPP